MGDGVLEMTDSSTKGVTDEYDGLVYGSKG